MSIAQRLRLLVAVGVATALIVGAAGLFARLVVAGEVEALLHDELPMAARHRDLLQALVDAETAERGYLLTGESSSLQLFAPGVARFRAAAADLDAAVDDPRLEHLLAREVELGTRWLDEFAFPIVAERRTDPTAALRRGASGEGRLRFDAFREAHEVTAALLEERFVAHHHRVDTVTRNTTAVVAVVILLGGALLGLLGVRTYRCTAHPLDRLVTTLSVLRRDRSARADEDGPEEIRAVAGAVNQLAEENERYVRERRQVVQRLRELDRQKSDFVSTVSHELRTPLTSIIGYLEMLEDGDAGDLTADQLQLLGVGQRNAGRLLSLIEDLLTLSRIESDALGHEERPVDLRDLVEAVTAELRPQLAGRDLALEVRSASVTVLGDRPQLERVLFNLVGNALKFTPDGGRVDVQVEVVGDRAELVVRDTGIGVPEEQLDQLFERFFRASTATERSIPGTGLGLAITRLLVERHGGRITAASTPGRGTTFVVGLPVHVDDRVPA